MTDNQNKDMADQEKPANGIGRWLVAAAFALLLIGFFAFDLDRHISFEGLAANEAALKRAVADNFALTVLAYMAVYIGAVALSLPGAVWLSLAGGLMFGTVQGGVIIVSAATLGACALFVAARYLLGDVLRAKAGPALSKFEANFNRDALSYMLILRLLPIFPFFIVNLGAALVGVRFSVFAVTTFFGIMPGSFVFASIGNGISVLLQAGQRPDLGIMTSPEIILPLIALALLSALPIVWRRMQDKKGASTAGDKAA